MTPQAPRLTFSRSSLLLLCGLSGVLAFQGGCAIVGSSTGSNNATVSGGVAQVCIECSAIPPETIAQLKAQGITEAALNQFFNDLGRKNIPPEKLDHELRDIEKTISISKRNWPHSRLRIRTLPHSFNMPDRPWRL